MSPHLARPLQEKYPSLRAFVAAFCASMWDGSAIVFLIFNALFFVGRPVHGSREVWASMPAATAARTAI